MSRWILDHIQAAHDAWKRTSDRLTQFVILVSLLAVSYTHLTLPTKRIV